MPGGYHPLELGEFLKNGRYHIVHKLGWGANSTTWAAKDQKENRYVAIKITTSNTRNQRELDVLRSLSTLPRRNPGWSRLNQMLDYFSVTGPNGVHACFVLDIVGPSVAEFVELHCKNDRLPASLARLFAKQALQGLDYLASNGIGHGDIHLRNLAIEVPGLSFLDEMTFLDKLGEPEISAVSRQDGRLLSNEVPAYVVRPTSFRQRDILISSQSVKIIDFGEAFFDNSPPRSLHTPLSVRAPEIIFGDLLDHRVDLWSAACMIFELVTGQPPFDVIMLTPPVLVQQMMELATDELPSRWQDKYRVIKQDIPRDDESYTLLQWLEEVYFDHNKQAEFSRKDIQRLSRLIERMLKFEPSLRATAKDILADPWFDG
ncbi:hypothetical protein HIM_05805 [Hirsutella minnesotensis 3608]|uniref:Protein kinase domain-containing protein n=1 Tax=Hirsutella minnesotensis 3608 TaxID=1043627 RepID=A0A0F7ZK20_9HYPO|nr:hypothetical protein HIM_05805 [Hirsutella minnesotensis 3608]